LIDAHFDETPAICAMFGSKKGRTRCDRGVAEWLVHEVKTVQNVLIKGRENINRAFDGDSVVVELLPESQWDSPSTRLPTKGSGSSEGPGGEGTGAASIAEVRGFLRMPKISLRSGLPRAFEYITVSFRQF
jgi:hypothetical protein